MTSRRLGFSGYVENISETLEGLILNGTKQDLKLKKKQDKQSFIFKVESPKSGYNS